MVEKIKGKRVLLASASPRRRELLGSLDIDVALAPLRKVDESYPSGMEPEEVPEYISRRKALAYAGDIADDEILVTADTVVINRGEVLGKPRDEEDACRMLRELSGHTHRVVTGVTIATSKDMRSFRNATDVTFTNLSEVEIRHYVEKYRPLDKAGAYGIQEWIGYIGVTSISGDYYNVMGLPLSALYAQLKEML